VVLAEDHAGMAAELRDLLAGDYDVVDIVDDGAALIEAAERELPDAIVCDIAMPRVNGLAAARALLAARADALIIFVTVQDSRAMIRKGIEIGARGYVLKCDAGRELLAAVQTVLDGGRYLSASARAVLRHGPDDSQETPCLEERSPLPD
jgi:DNA-binding NarL/FixJ family response regulator